MPLVAKIKTCDGEAIPIALSRGVEEPWELRSQTLAGGLILVSSCIFFYIDPEFTVSFVHQVA